MGGFKSCIKKLVLILFNGILTMPQTFIFLNNFGILTDLKLKDGLVRSQHLSNRNRI